MSARVFAIQSRDRETAARTGTLSLPHGDVQTPAFMPVGTNATVKAIHHADLDEMGIRIILGNTYHLYLRPGIEVIGAAGGLHRFSTWPHNILTDSGGYQVFSLSPYRKISEDGVRFRSHIDGSYHELDAEKIVDIQKAMGSDIFMPLDVCTAPGIDHRKASEAARTTHAWLARSVARWREVGEGWDGLLFGIVQGNFYEDLRKESAERVADFDTPGIAVGGLSVGESTETFERFLEYTAALLPTEKPHYVMGIGTPEYILSAVGAGIDIFDCVFPTRIARNGLVFTRNGPLPLKKAYNRLDFGPIDPACGCPVCSRYSRAYLRHLFKANEILGAMLATRHNLTFMHEFLADIRSSIEAGSFRSFASSFLDLYRQERPET